MAESTKQRPMIPEGCTLFVKNIPLGVSEEELFNKFKGFGKLRYARIVIDKITNQSRGTGFVCFQKQEDAADCLEQMKIVERESLAGSLVSGSFVLLPEAPSAIASKFSLAGKVLVVMPALAKKEAVKLAEERATSKKSVDKRNLYLLREGVIFADTAAAEGLTDVDLKKCERSYIMRKKLLKTNPSLHVSKTRLCIKGLPRLMNDKMLKELAKHSIHLFKKEVIEGLRDRLTEEERKEGWDKRPKVIQAKVEKEQGGTGKKRKVGPSKGFGFVQFAQHAHALACLRYLNNNPDLEIFKSNSKGNRKRLTVEFAVDNVVTLRYRQIRNERLNRKLEKEGDDSGRVINTEHATSDLKEAVTRKRSVPSSRNQQGGKKKVRKLGKK